MFPAIEQNIISLHTSQMDVFSENMCATSIEKDSDTASSTCLHSPHIGLSEPEDTFSSESEYFDDKDMHAACYDDKSVCSGLEADSEHSSDARKMFVPPFHIT
jgi:hypothetical protein